MVILQRTTSRILSLYEGVNIVVLAKSPKNDVSNFVKCCFYDFDYLELDFLRSCQQ